MIRINLLATERRGAKAAVPPGFQVRQKMLVVGSLILVLSAAGVGWRYWALSQQQEKAQKDIDTAKREEARLHRPGARAAGTAHRRPRGPGAGRRDHAAGPGRDEGTGG